MVLLLESTALNSGLLRTNYKSNLLGPPSLRL